MPGNNIISNKVLMKKGSIIHQEKPFIHVLQSELRELRCDHCFLKADLRKCAGCSYIKYCGVICQKAEWKYHKHECSQFKILPSHKTLPNAARVLAKIIIKLQKGGDVEKGFYGKQSFRTFKDLMSHYSNIKSDPKRIEHVTSLYEVLKDFLQLGKFPNFSEFLGLYGRMVINGFSILDEEMTSVGTGIYLGASTLDHSCLPNAAAIFSGTTLSIKTITDIPQYDWSKVRISYVDTLCRREDRQMDLHSVYYFTCLCERCTEIESMETAGVCQKCKGVIYSDKMICNICNWKATDSFAEKYKEILEFCIICHQKMKDIVYWDACKHCLEKEKGIIHPESLIHIKTVDLAFEAAIQQKAWDEAIKLGYELIPGYRKYYGECHPLTGFHLKKLGKILMFVENVNCHKILEEGDRILQMSTDKRHMTQISF